MKNLLLTAVSITAMAQFASATDYMNIELTDGSTNSYNVDEIEQIYFTSDSIPGNLTGTRPLPPPTTVNGTVDNYNYVDLGLTSGTLWATYNVGAESVTEKGNYYSWAETEPAILNGKEIENWGDYKWCENHTFGEYDAPADFFKYVTNEEYGQVSGYEADNYKVVRPEDDVATVVWGEKWRMPTDKELEELKDGCYWIWVKDFNGSGTMGHLGVSKVNGNTIFLPSKNSTSGFYWSSDLDAEKNHSAIGLVINRPTTNGEECQLFSTSFYRNFGHSVRPVLKKKDELPVEPTISGEIGEYSYVDLGLPSGTKWATRNVGANVVSEKGNMYSWAETEPAILNGKENENWGDYKWCENHTFGEYNNPADFFKYVTSADYVNNGSELDNLTTILPEDDAATVNWNDNWRMPTKEECEELVNGCEWTWSRNFNGTGKYGHIGVSKYNGNIIFLPGLNSTSGFYWTSDLSVETNSSAYGMLINRPSYGETECTWYVDTFPRNFGFTIRPVAK